MVGPYKSPQRGAFPRGSVSFAGPSPAHLDVAFSPARLKFCFATLFTVLSPEGDQT